MNELWIDYWVGTALLSTTAFVVGGFACREITARIIRKLRFEIENLHLDKAEMRAELEVCWKHINSTTQAKRKKEEAAKPRDSKGRYAKKVKA